MSAILPSPKDWPSILLARAGAADPTDLDAAIKSGAFEGLRRAVRQLGPAGTIHEIEASGLRGRGGAGHLTAEKWRTAAETPATRRYVVANGYGADPSASTDRTLLETDPYAVIEGAAIAAFAIGAEDVVHLRPRRPRPRRFAGWRPRSTPRRRATSSATTRWGAAAGSRSRSGPCRAPTCSARRRSS